MRKESEVIARIAEFSDRLLHVEACISEELTQHYEKRNKSLLLFLHKEKCVWQFAIEQMKWLLEEK
ncbi:hypothetical protein [Chitinophaga flava]|uniref:Uncharacterized protein n=1 Tax=Chitinophaga flava TaxID=2259036 RepID=A0A365XP75_9BACT|nr:hypothetical protein [Chitinophaga flava]RBL88149.1 hypothetical protein DF182_32020 [Chitinophaga flava]